MRYHRLLPLFLLAIVAGPLAAQAPGADRRIALTFDDLPMTGAAVCDPAHVRMVTLRLTGVIESRRVPAAGLATPGRSCISSALLRETLQRWRAVGAIIGNHTATHLDLNATPIAEYLANIEAAQRLIDATGTDTDRWFRAPYLHMGSDSARKQALAGYLTSQGYRVAPVTVDNQEWVYAAVYADARRRGDAALAERVAGAYLSHLEESMIFYESLSRAVLGREVPQVLLLHANLLNADLLGPVITMLAGRGYRFVALAEAVKDRAYGRRDPYIGPRGLSWLQRWAIEQGVTVPPEPREARWVADEFEAIQRRVQAGGDADS